MRGFGNAGAAPLLGSGSLTGIGQFFLSWLPWQAGGPPGLIIGSNGADDVEAVGPVAVAFLRGGDDTFHGSADVRLLYSGRGDDTVLLDAGAAHVSLGDGDDTLTAKGHVGYVSAGRGDDSVTLYGGAGLVQLGSGDDTLEIYRMVGSVDGGRGFDTMAFDFNLGEFDIRLSGGSVEFAARFSGEVMTVRSVESFEFSDVSISVEEIETDYDDGATPLIRVGGGTQTVTVNDPSPTVSVMWDRTVQQAVIDHDGFNGPTLASRAYAMVHTAIYDAWASYDATAVRVSFDANGNNAGLEAAAFATDANKAKAMSYAAYTILNNLYPDQKALFDSVLQGRYGYDPDGDGSLEAQIGMDAAADLIALRFTDGANQAGNYAGDFTPTNPNPLEINDITAWTPESVPVDPEDTSPEQRFLTPQWGGVESFALPEFANGETDFATVAPPAPKDFFVNALAGSVLDFEAREITLSGAVTVNGIDYSADDVLAVSKDLIGPVINQGFIDQALEVVAYSANLTDKQKIIAEFWEDAGGTAFPPGTFMTFGQYVSARDGHTLGQDAAMFLAMGNAVMDAGIATWHTKVETDYVRPVRAIRDLGELGLIGEWGVDELTGEEGYVIEAWGGYEPETREGLGTMTILAENFQTFQRPFDASSPPFAEYTSGHSGFSSAGAQVLKMFTGSDDFGGSVTFTPGSTQFELGVPELETVLDWATFTDAANEAGLSRLYGGIHFSDGNLNGLALGRDVGAHAYLLSQAFIDGTATDEDRPFWADDFSFVA